MLAVTERAKEKLKSILLSKVDNPQAALRLTATGQGQLGLMVDVETPGDEVVEHQGSKVLLIEKELATRLEGTTLDVEDTPDGPELAVFDGHQG